MPNFTAGTPPSTRISATPADTSRGNGVLLWFVVDDFDAVVDRANASGAEVLEGPTFNTGAQQHEIRMRGPEGYAVVVASVRVSPG